MLAAQPHNIGATHAGIHEERQRHSRLGTDRIPAFKLFDLFDLLRLKAFGATAKVRNIASWIGDYVLFTHPPSKYLAYRLHASVRRLR